MISLYKNQHAIWILLHILNYTTGVEYGTLWTNINNGQPTRIPPAAPGKACQWPYYNNLNKINGSRQQPYINYGTRYGKVNKTNFGNYETINNKHGADPVHHDDRGHIIKNIKYNGCPYSSRKAVSLIGYDDGIYDIMHNITAAGHTGPVVVYFYLYQTYKYINIGRVRTYPHILDQILSKYNHFNCINSNQIMIPRENSIHYADECIKNCDNLTRDLNLYVNDLKHSMESYLDFFGNNDGYGKANCPYNVMNQYKNYNDIKESNNSPAMINSLWLPQNHFKILTNIENGLHDPYKFVENTKPNVQSKVIHFNKQLNDNISQINNKNKNNLPNLPNNGVVNKFLENVNTNWMDKYCSNNPGQTNLFSSTIRDIDDTKDTRPDLCNESMSGQKEIVTLEQAQICHSENNEFKVEAPYKNNYIKTLSNNFGILTANKKPTKALRNTVPLEENNVKQESNKLNISYELLPISNENTDSYLPYSIIQYPKQMYNTDIDEISVSNRSSCNPFCINCAEDQDTHSGQILVPYKSTGSYETADGALASNPQDYKIVPFQEQYSNQQSVAEANSSIPKALAYSFIKPEINIQKIFSTDLTNANIGHLNPIEPSLFSAQTETFDSNPTLKYMIDSKPGSDMHIYDLIKTNENKASSAEKLDLFKLKTKTSNLPQINKYILSEKVPTVYNPTCTNTPPALKWPGFYSQRELLHLENVLSQRPTSPPLYSLANTKPVQTSYENTNSFDIPSGSHTQYSSDFLTSKLLKGTIPSKHIPSLKVSLKPWYEAFETTIENPLQQKATNLNSPISYLSNFQKNQQSVLNKPAKLTSNLSFNIPYILVPIQWDKTSTPESNIKDMSMQDQNKSSLKCGGKPHLLQTLLNEKYHNLLPCNCNTKIQDTPYVNFAQSPQISNKKYFIKPKIDYYDPASKTKINHLITPLRTQYQTSPKGKTMVSSDVKYIPTKIPSLYSNIESFKIAPKLSNTGNTMSYLTSVEIPKLPSKMSLNSEKINIIPFTYPRRVHQNLPAWTQIYYQLIDNVPNQNKNLNFFDDSIINSESNKAQEKEPLTDLSKTIINRPYLKYKVFNAPNSFKYYSPSQNKPSYLPTNNRPFVTKPNLSFTNIYDISTSPNKTLQSPSSLIPDPQNESNKGKSVSHAKPCEIPLMSQILQTYEPKSSEVLKHLINPEPISYSKPLVPESISSQRKLQNFGDLNFPLSSTTSNGKHKLYLPYDFKDILPNLQLSKVDKIRRNQNLPTWSQKYYQPITIEHQNLFDHSILNVESHKDQLNESIMDLSKTINKPHRKYNVCNVPHENTANDYTFSKPSYLPTNNRHFVTKPNLSFTNIYGMSISPNKPPHDQYSLISKLQNGINEGYSISDGIAKPCNNISMSQILETYEPKTPMVLQQFYQEPISLLQTLAPELVPPQSKVNDLHISNPYIEINDGQSIYNGDSSLNFPLMSRILQASEPNYLEVLKPSIHHEPNPYYSKTLIRESISPQRKQLDFKEPDYSLARFTTYGKPPLYLPYDLKNKLHFNIQHNHQSNLNFNQARNIKEAYFDKLYGQPNGQGIPNLTHKGPVSSTPYMHKHPPIEYTNPMGKIIPRTLSNDSLGPKPRIQFTTISKPMKNILEQIIPNENMPHYVGTKKNKIPKQIIEEVNERNPKTSILQDIKPRIINTVKFYDPLICKPHTTTSLQTNPSSELKHFDPNKYPTNNLKEIISLQNLKYDLKTRKNLPHKLSRAKNKSFTLPVTYESVSTKQPFISNAKNNIKYYTKPYDPSLIIDTNLFNRMTHGQEISSQKPARYKSYPYSAHGEETSIKYYQPQFFKQNDFKGSTLNKPQSTKLGEIQPIQYYERSQELMSPQTETQQLLKNSNDNSEIKDEIPTDLTHIPFDIQHNNNGKDNGKHKLWPGRYLNPYTTTKYNSIVNSSSIFNYLPKESSTTSLLYLYTKPSTITDKKLQSENSLPQYQINGKEIKEQIPKALLAFSCVPLTDQRKYNSWAARYSPYLSNLSPCSNPFTFDTKGKTAYPKVQDIFTKPNKHMPQLRSFIQELLPNLQQNPEYWSPLSQYQENLYEINDIIEEDISKEPVSKIQGKGQTSGVKYDLMISKNVCPNSSTDPITTITSTPIAAKSYRPSFFGYTPKISWKVNPQTETPLISTKYETISTSTQTPILNTTPSLKIWSNLYKNSANAKEPLLKEEDIENIERHINGDLLYNPYLYQRLKHLGDTNKYMSKHNIPAYRVLRTDNDNMAAKYNLEYLQQPTNLALQTQPSPVPNSLDPLSANSLDETTVLPFSQTHAVFWATDNHSNPWQAPPKGTLQNINAAPRLSENTSNLFETDIHTPNTFRISSNMPQDNLGAIYYQHISSIAVPTVTQSLGNILATKQTPKHFNSKLFKNNNNPPQNVIRCKPIQGQYLHDAKEFLNLKGKYRVRPFIQCKNCDCKVCAQNPTIMDQIIKQVYDYSKKFPDFRVYEPHTDVTNDKITIPLGEMGLAKYEVTKPNEYFVKTEIPGLFIKAWGSKIKIIKPKLIFDVKEYEGFNFLPIIENHHYSSEFAQNVAKDIVTRLYGEPIVINGVYGMNSPYAIINDINNGLVNDGKAYILWPTLCNCGCMRSGCKCCFSKYG